MGTPEFAVPALREVARTCDVVAVVTQPDRPSGRGLAAEPSAVAKQAQLLGLTVWKPDDMKSGQTLQAMRKLEPDLFAVVAFGSILTPDMLRVPKLGAINLHGSLLPDYRGASPVQRALWDGRKATGVTTLWMDEDIDTGDMILREETKVNDEDDAASLGVRLAEIGAPLLAESLKLAFEGSAPRTPQNRAHGSYAKKLKKNDGVVSWERRADEVWHHQRAVTPWPGATTGFRGQRIRLERTRVAAHSGEIAAPGTVVGIGEDGVEVACAAGSLRLVKLKPEGRSLLDAAAWARGVRLTKGERFESERMTHA